MFFSANTYNGPGVHPDYATHNGSYPVRPGGEGTDQIYDPTFYGRVYDILGRQVSVLVNEWQDAGDHEVKFDGWGLTQLQR